MSKRVFLDAETIPPSRDDPLVLEKYPQCAEEEFRSLALNPEYGKLLCLGIIIEQDGVITRRGVIGRDRETKQFHLDEERLLCAFWKLISDFNQQRDLLIGFNILDFDLHFICTRSVIRKIRPSINVCFARFRARPVFDVMWEFSHWRHRISLDDLAKILGLPTSKNGIDGSMVYDLFLAGRHEEIANYCMRDVELTRSIYHRLNFIEESAGGESENDPVR